MMNTVSILKKITDFLNLPSYNWQSENLQIIGQSKYLEDIPKRLKSQLRNFYQAHNDELYKLIGISYNWN